MLKLLLAVIVVLFGIYFYGYPIPLQIAIKYVPFLESSFLNSQETTVKTKSHSSNKSQSKLKIFTEEDLKRYVNKEAGLYLAILGEVYDVSKGVQHYGPGGTYHFFTGRDASRAFVTGDFSENGLNNDVLDLDPQDIKSLFKWVSVYKRQYKYKGKLIGRYFDSEGNPTGYRYKVENKLKLAEEDEIAKNKEKLRMPPCNSEWSVDQGTRVWCSKMSGGIQRDWVGVPRMLYTVGADTFRCACLNPDEITTNHMGNLKEYPECNPKATSCFVHN